MPDTAAPTTGEHGVDPYLELVERYPRALDPQRRRRDGVHYTPVEVARSVLDLVWGLNPAIPRTVCDPSCGAGAFLLVVAERLAYEGVPADEIVTRRLVGLELDPAAAALAREALSDWARRRGAPVAPDQVRVHVADSLTLTPDRCPGRPPDGFDLVVGNPPFRSQLAARTARDTGRREQLRARFGHVGAYTDDAGLFLVLAAELAGPGGAVAMVQPQSLLSARDAAAVREQVLADTDLVGLWAHDGSPFPDAQVRVCAPVLRRRAHRHDAPPGVAAGAGTCEVRWCSAAGSSPGGDRRHHLPCPSPGATWSALLADASGVPELPPLPGPPLSGLATATAGFRDEFYALCASAVDTSPATSIAGDGAALPSGATPALGPKLVSVGMIDPLRLRWGAGTFRLHGRRMAAPQVDQTRLAAAAPKVARWARARSVPKVLVATQTKVVEAVADPGGDTVPLTPVISVEPVAGGPDVWHLAAMLCAPPVSALALRSHLGAARSAGALRWSARSVLEVPCPEDLERWNQGARLARRVQLAVPGSPSRERDLEQLGALMTVAYGLPEHHPVVEWWWGRHPRR